MSELIERQAAIDALESIGSLDTEADKKYARSVFEALPTIEREWLHDLLQDAIDDGIITEVQAVKIIERVSKYGVTSR